MVSAYLALIVLSLIGIADASYITYEEFMGLVPPCLPLPYFDCAGVLQSAWSHIGPIPLSLFGIGFYGLVFILSVYGLVAKKSHPFLRHALLLLGVWGFLFSAFLFGVQAFVLKAFCLFCLVSAVSSTLIFLTSWLNFARGARVHND